LTLTVGLTSPLADVPDCGGAGPVVTDGKRVIQLVLKTDNFVHQFIRARQATIILYESTSPTSAIGQQHPFSRVAERI
jgi:hypothetical protein